MDPSFWMINDAFYMLIGFIGIVIIGYLIDRYESKKKQLQETEIVQKPPIITERQLTDQEILNKKCHEYLTTNHW